MKFNERLFKEQHMRLNARTIIAAVLGLLVFIVTSNASAQEKREIEIGANYVAALGDLHWAFAHKDGPLGDPASTIDWTDLTTHIGEVYLQFSNPTGFYAKAVAGQGLLTEGLMTDRDFFQRQYKWSDMSSKSVSGGTNYALVDLGYTKHINGQWRVIAFGGYHYWREDVTSFGLIDNLYPNANPDLAQLDDQKVIRYETTWHAFRLGGGSGFTITDRWSLDVEWAFVPKAGMLNEDSHFLRTSRSDLGPVPNVLSHSSQGAGREVQANVGYRFPKNFQTTFGIRYWKLRATEGLTEFGPDFGNALLRLEESRQVGLLVGIKKTF
ncbi:MAG: outer membrane beta-barrel protein [Candidatus Doudnabacteria bacterium]|nr:outer membrane beta-barrel protein [Candidatus Doudnabacteria bacterium]